MKLNLHCTDITTSLRPIPKMTQIKVVYIYYPFVIVYVRNKFLYCESPLRKPNKFEFHKHPTDPVHVQCLKYFQMICIVSWAYFKNTLLSWLQVAMFHRGVGGSWIRHLLKLCNGNCDHALQSDTKSCKATKVRPLPLYAALWLVVLLCLLLHVTASISYSISSRQLPPGGVRFSRQEWTMFIAKINVTKLRFDAFTVMTMKIIFFWDVKTCILAKKYQRFGEKNVVSLFSVGEWIEIEAWNSSEKLVFFDQTTYCHLLYFSSLFVE